MKCRRPLPCMLWIALILLAGCKKAPGAFDAGGYGKELQAWKEKRLARLTREDGWLTLCGLFWLKEGENTCGSDSSNGIIFPPGKAPKRAGSILLARGTARFLSSPGAEVRCNDSLVASMALAADDSPDPTILTCGTLRFYVIKRGDQFAVRVKDSENPARKDFKGLDYFPADARWRIEARFEPYTPPKMLRVPSIVGTVETDSCPGAIAFEVGGTPCRIDAVIEKGVEDELFIMFADSTNGRETYQVGRQLYAPLPDSAGKVILDFNKAYNWPCVFTVYATCPIPPPQNHLPFRVDAGEKMYRGH